MGGGAGELGLAWRSAGDKTREVYAGSLGGCAGGDKGRVGDT